MRVALAQIRSGTEPAANLDLVEDSTRRAADAGARLVLFPEATMCRLGVPLASIAEPLDGPWATGVRQIAERAGIVVVAGMYVPAGWHEGRARVTNTLIATGPGVDAHYDKIHLYDAFGFAESDTVRPGATPVVVDVDGETIGLATCYDIRFPELFRALADRGASTVLLPASWGAGEGKVEQWELLVRARALDSTTFVVACDQADPLARGIDPGKAPRGVGHSLVSSPFGTIVESLGADPGLLVVDVDTASVEKTRQVLPVLANRRM
jgi:predicted amidohydrolase